MAAAAVYFLCFLLAFSAMIEAKEHAKKEKTHRKESIPPCTSPADCVAYGCVSPAEMAICTSQFPNNCCP
jgi:hypothetical protein